MAVLAGPEHGEVRLERLQQLVNHVGAGRGVVLVRGVEGVVLAAVVTSLRGVVPGAVVVLLLGVAGQELLGVVVQHLSLVVLAVGTVARVHQK